MAWVKSWLNESPWTKPTTVGLLFYIAVPVIIGVTFFRLGAPDTHVWPLAFAVVYSIAQVITGWFIKDIFCALVAKAARPRGLSLLSILIIGGSLAHIVIFPFNIGLRAAFEIALLPPEVHLAAVNLETWLENPLGRFASAFVQGAMPAVVLWVTVSLIFFHILGMSRYGYLRDSKPIIGIMPTLDDHAAQAERVVAPAATGRPTFVDLLPPKLRNHDIIAVKAEEHYVRVITSAGESLIHERFRSVIGEFERFGGIKVHRSYAINPAFVARVETSDGGMQVVMANGTCVPVSRSYIGVARQLRI
jgi:hypothetical protein